MFSPDFASNTMKSPPRNDGGEVLQRHVSDWIRYWRDGGSRISSPPQSPCRASASCQPPTQALAAMRLIEIPASSWRRARFISARVPQGRVASQPGRRGLTWIRGHALDSRGRDTALDSLCIEEPKEITLPSINRHRLRPAPPSAPSAAPSPLFLPTGSAPSRSGRPWRARGRSRGGGRDHPRPDPHGRQRQNPARQAAIAAGIPPEQTALGLDQLCGSGLRAVALAEQIATGDAGIVVAGGQAP